MAKNNIIKKVLINGFRSIDSETISFDKVNVFSGTNDSGKSNILRALNLFFNRQTDFQTNLRFIDDYSKISFARAVRSSKGKQQIKIRLYFNAPDSYRSLDDEKEIFVERAFDRFGHMTERYSNDKKRREINRLLNRIKYLYIPALKGKDVLQYILGLIGEYELIEQEDIEALNEKINIKTNDLTTILSNSQISIGTTFGLPVFLRDFWEKLSVDTKYEKLAFLEENIRGKESGGKLNPASFKIPLTSRGEGIKSKYIPPLLLWLQNNNSRNIYIWGIDEPENSLEFGLAEELASLYYSNYGSKVQIFLTSHSLAFINPSDDVKIDPRLFRCIKGKDGATSVKIIEELKNSKNEMFGKLGEELGILEVQKKVINEYRRIQEEKKKIEKNLSDVINELKEYKSPIILTEGKTDMTILKTAWKKLYASERMPFSIIPSGIEINVSERTGNADQVKRTLELVSNLDNITCIIGVFDNDREGNEKFKGLSTKIFESFNIKSDARKHKKKNIFGLLLPVPNFRKIFVTSDDIKHRYFVIEHYFSNNVLSK
jgi:AAA15 family ATPase/GTPase